MVLLLAVGMSEGTFWTYHIGSGGIYRGDMGVVQASEILAKIESGEPVEYNHVIVEGDLDLEIGTKTGYFTSLRTGGEMVVMSPISITDSEIRGEVILAKTLGTAIFRESVDFRGTNFSGNAYFDRSQFSDDVYFSNARFSGIADFPGVQFNGDANFWGAQFNGDASFGQIPFVVLPDGTILGNVGAQFSGDVDFSKAQFDNDADFSGAQFNGSANYSGAQFYGDADFEDALFQNDLVLNDNVKFTQLVINGAIINRLVSDRRSIYFTFIENFKDNGQYDAADNLYYQYRSWLMLNTPLGWQKIIDFVALCSCGFGVRPGYTLGLSLVIIFFFGGLFWKIGALEVTSSNQPFTWLPEERKSSISLKEAIYFSSLVFIHTWPHPKLRPSERWKYVVLIEDVLGWLILALFLVTLGNVMIR